MPAIFQQEARPQPCDGCTVCCILPKIDWLNKPAKTACSHLCGQGCGIYATRPQGCIDFECLYRAGHIHGGERFRPDNFGVMFTPNLTGDLLVAYEARPGAFSDHKVMYEIRRISEKRLIFLKHYDGRSELAGPPEMVRATLKAKGLA